MKPTVDLFGRIKGVELPIGSMFQQQRKTRGVNHHGRAEPFFEVILSRI
ncbi:hypothetical protein CSC28_7040 (plasmid) [Pseudomonas paraeruginosa]|nr:hypothetical protein CSC28_7040 [Pseudomonas paraeruginosa]